MGRNFIDLEDFNNNEIRQILNHAIEIKSKLIDYRKSLYLKSLGILFEKKSLRTKVSFDVAMKNMGGNVIELDPKSIGFGTRESDSDIIKILSQYIDCLVVRNKDHEKIKMLSNCSQLSIINGLSDYSHPCQSLSDIFTIQEIKGGSIEDKLIVWCGDVTNVLRSLLQLSKIIGFSLNLALPEQIIEVNEMYLDKYKSDKVKICGDPFEAVENADCIMTDVWFSMGEKRSEEKLKLMKDYQINEKLMKRAKDSAIFMHCLPAIRNEEVTDSIIDGKTSVVWQQAQNRIYVQQSILSYCIT